jgi:hypothetical protein
LENLKGQTEMDLYKEIKEFLFGSEEEEDDVQDWDDVMHPPVRGSGVLEPEKTWAGGQEVQEEEQEHSIRARMLTAKHQALCDKIGMLQQSWSEKIEATGMGPYVFDNYIPGVDRLVCWKSAEPDKIVMRLNYWRDPDSPHQPTVVDASESMPKALELCRAANAIDSAVHMWVSDIEDTLRTFDNRTNELRARENREPRTRKPGPK